MAVDRTWYNTLVDDSGGGFDGSIIAKADIDALMDAIDAALAAVGSSGATIQTTTLTGTQNNFAATAARRLIVYCNNASALTITGIAAGTDGDDITFVSIGAGTVSFSHQAAGSTAANRLINLVTSAPTPLAAGVGTARYVYDGTATRWRLVAHEQGAAITPAFSAGDYTQDSGTWTVASGNVSLHNYYLKGRQLFVKLKIDSSTVASTPGVLKAKVPGGFAIATGPDVLAIHVLAAVRTVIYGTLNAGIPSAFFSFLSGSFPNGTSNTGIYAEYVVDVS